MRKVNDSMVLALVGSRQRLLVVICVVVLLSFQPPKRIIIEVYTNFVHFIQISRITYEYVTVES